MGPQVELLEHHGQVGADAQDLLGIGRAARQPLASPDDWLALEQDFALLAVFQQVAAAQQGRFARSRRSDQRHHVALLGGDVDAFDHFQLAIGFVQAADLQNGRCIGQGVFVPVSGNSFLLDRKKDRMQRSNRTSWHLRRQNGGLTGPFRKGALRQLRRADTLLRQHRAGRGRHRQVIAGGEPHQPLEAQASLCCPHPARGWRPRWP